MYVLIPPFGNKIFNIQNVTKYTPISSIYIEILFIPVKFCFIWVCNICGYRWEVRYTHNMTARTERTQNIY